MKAITLTQPWASLVAHGHKTIETRSWSTAYRGPLLIHAAKGFPAQAQALCQTHPFMRCLEQSGYRRADDLPRGALLAVVELVAVLPMTPAMLAGQPGAWDFEERGVKYSQIFTHMERAFGDYRVGRYAFILRNVRPFSPSIPALGKLSLWEWPFDFDISKLAVIDQMAH